MWVGWASSLLLAVVFAWAGLTKILSPDRWRKDLQAYRLGRPLRAVGLLLVPWLEVLVPVAAFLGLARPASSLALALLLAFSIAIVRARILVGSNQLACGCFGGHATRDYRLLLLRNVLLAAPAGYVMVFGAVPAPIVGREVAGRPALLLGGLGLVAAGWILWRIRLHLRGRDTQGPPG